MSEEKSFRKTVWGRVFSLANGTHTSFIFKDPKEEIGGEHYFSARISKEFSEKASSQMGYDLQARVEVKEGEKDPKVIELFNHTDGGTVFRLGD